MWHQLGNIFRLSSQPNPIASSIIFHTAFWWEGTSQYCILTSCNSHWSSCLAFFHFFRHGSSSLLSCACGSIFLRRTNSLSITWPWPCTVSSKVSFCSVSCWIICSNVSLLVFKCLMRSACFSNFSRWVSTSCDIDSRFTSLSVIHLRIGANGFEEPPKCWLMAQGRGSSLWEYTIMLRKIKSRGQWGTETRMWGMITRLCKGSLRLEKCFPLGKQGCWQQRHLSWWCWANTGRITLFLEDGQWISM